MKIRYTFMIAAAVVGVLAVLGLFNAQNCSQIGACRNCWSDSAVQVTSELCSEPGKPCTAQPYLQQHNAVVDTLLCACANAKIASYRDAALNKQIEDAHFAMRGGCSPEILAVSAATREANGVFCTDPEPDRVNAQELCDSPAQYVAKRPYG